MIRRQATTLYRAVSELSANSRWCITGTPIQNRLEDIGALFAFIRARPFDSMAMFRRFIAVPFDENEEHRAIATQRLSLLLDSLCLRRMKELLDLPEQQNRTRTLEFSKEERNQYERTKKIMIRAIRQRAGELDGKGAFGMFQAQLQLRILCNHGTFQHSFSWARRSLLNEREDALCAMGQNGEINCSSCRQSMPILGFNNVHKTYADKCAHVLCSECWDENAEHSGGEGSTAPRCPLCFPIGAPASADAVEYSYSNEDGLHDNYFRSEGHSSKIAALMSDVREGLWENKRQVYSSNIMVLSNSNTPVVKA
jgi:SWI/SNF-related matrix-associated actin-dependent regulator of chromatin subfamily A3